MFRIGWFNVWEPWRRKISIISIGIIHTVICPLSFSYSLFPFILAIFVLCSAFLQKQKIVCGCWHISDASEEWVLALAIYVKTAVTWNKWNDICPFHVVFSVIWLITIARHESRVKASGAATNEMLSSNTTKQSVSKEAASMFQARSCQLQTNGKTWSFCGRF